MASIRDVAEKAGVSVATVSRVINDDSGVSVRLRDRTLKAMEELAYEPSGIARSMRNQSVPVIGLIITDIENPFFTSMVRAVEDVARQNGHSVVLCNSDEDLAKEEIYLSVLSMERVAGAIIVPTGEDSFEPLKNFRLPKVVVDRKLHGLTVDMVILDNISGAHEATKHLIDLGHRHIGLVSASPKVSVAQERQAGYVNALTEQDIPIDNSLIELGDFKKIGGYTATKRLLKRTPRPTAIFATNNLMCMGALQAISELRLRIPDDVSVIGFDDMAWLPLLRPPLTAVRQPVYEIGEVATKLLFRRLEGHPGAKIETITMQPELIVRRSTAPPKS